MRILMLFALLTCAAVSQVAHAQTSDFRTEVVQFYSEGVLCKAKLYSPTAFSESAKAAAVVVAPGAKQTRASVEQYAAQIARSGIVALAIDYRGWGECGGFLYFGEPVRWDDRLRFTQMTATMRIRRQRLDPKAQVIDIRNAITYLQGIPNIDRARIGVWGTDLSGGHAIVTAGSDARVKAVVAQVPLIAGKDEVRGAFAPSAEQQATMIRLARNGAPPTNERTAKSMNADEEQLGLAEYRPYWYLEQIPQSTGVLFIVAEHDEKVDNDSHAVAAAKVLKGPSSVTMLAAAKHDIAGKQAQAANAAAKWFAERL